MKRFVMIALTGSTLVLGGTAWSKGPTPQNHHCMKDGAEMINKTKKECTKEGGKWEKMSTPGTEGTTGTAPGTNPSPMAPAK